MNEIKRLRADLDVVNQRLKSSEEHEKNILSELERHRERESGYLELLKQKEDLVPQETVAKNTPPHPPKLRRGVLA